MRPPPQLHEFYRYPITTGTIALALMVTLGWWAEMNVEPLMLSHYGVANGEWWRFLSSALPHGSTFHLLFNLFWLWIFGSMVEQHFGDLKTVGIFVLLAGGSAAAEFAFFSGGVGLSGVGYGLFAMLWVLSRNDHRFWGAMPDSTVFVFVGWFFLCILLTALNILNIANVAHASGAGLGALLGMSIASKKLKQHLWTAALAATVAFFFIGAVMIREHINFYYW